MIAPNTTIGQMHVPVKRMEDLVIKNNLLYSVIFSFVNFCLIPWNILLFFEHIELEYVFAQNALSVHEDHI